MTNRKLRALKIFVAHVALLGIVFQVAALDHWSPASIEEVRGIERTHLHATHCHGGAASCADGGNAPFWLTAGAATTPLPPAPNLEALVVLDATPSEAPVADVLHPPRVA